jgi:hypothetical protein
MKGNIAPEVPPVANEDAGSAAQANFRLLGYGPAGILPKGKAARLLGREWECSNRATDRRLRESHVVIERSKR